jgi:PDZ domain
MRCRVLIALIFTTVSIAQDSPKSAHPSEPKSVTVPFTLDHDRIIIDVSIPLSNGTTQRVRAWVDNGNPELYLSRRLSGLVGGSTSCDERLCSGAPPSELIIGGMTITIGTGIKEAKVPVGDAPIAPGLSAEMSIPSTILRNHDVLINFPDREFTIAQRGTLKFKGVTAKVIVNPANGLIQVPSQIENKKYNLALDLGSSISFLAADLFDKLSAAHPDWPHMTGAVGPANMRGSNDEPTWKLMRVDRLQYGPLFLTDVAVVDLHAEKGRMPLFEKQAGGATAGQLGSEALLNYRVGLDYAHSTVYFDIGRTFNVPDFDVIGLILRPEDDGHFTILGIAESEGKPSVAEVQAGDRLIAIDGIPVAGSTMGQVWSRLAGEAGKEHTLTVERNGKRFAVIATVQHFLGENGQ